MFILATKLYGLFNPNVEPFDISILSIKLIGKFSKLFAPILIPSIKNPTFSYTEFKGWVCPRTDIKGANAVPEYVWIPGIKSESFS